MSEFLRKPYHRYEDPLACIWTLCAERIGFRIERTPDVYAATDGRGAILIGTDDILDPDDSLAQMILHELCHALVEGEDGEMLPDWGLDNTSKRHLRREHACLRLQAHLAGSVGLRDFFAPTTDFRVRFWEVLPPDPFAAAPEAGGRREPSCVAARIAAWRAGRPRWAPHLKTALKASAAIAALMANSAGTRRHSEEPASHDGQGPETLPSLWTTVGDPPQTHPAGHAAIAEYHAGHGCFDCAWSFTLRGRLRCRHLPTVRLAEQAPACTRWEPAQELDCLQCGACCREAYQAVEIKPREAVNRRHPDLVLTRDEQRKLRRDGDRCAALVGGLTSTEPYSCAIYDDRPRTCHDFTRGGAHCLDARQRVGLSL